MSCLADIDVAILCGGKGTRARFYLGDTPKVLAPINGRPLIEHLLDYLIKYRPGRIILITGHGGEQVERWLSNWARGELYPGTIEICRDTELKGCGNALFKAREAFRSNLIFIMNGDTLLFGDLEPIVFNMRHRSPCVLTVGGLSSGVCLTDSQLVEAKYFLAIPMEALFDFSFIDIGTLQGYRRAQEYFGDHHKDAV